MVVTLTLHLQLCFPELIHPDPTKLFIRLFFKIQQSGKSGNPQHVVLMNHLITLLAILTPHLKSAASLNHQHHLSSNPKDETCCYGSTMMNQFTQEAASCWTISPFYCHLDGNSLIQGKNREAGKNRKTTQSGQEHVYKYKEEDRNDSDKFPLYCCMPSARLLLTFFHLCMCCVHEHLHISHLDDCHYVALP